MAKGEKVKCGECQHSCKIWGTRYVIYCEKRKRDMQADYHFCSEGKKKEETTCK